MKLLTSLLISLIFTCSVQAQTDTLDTIGRAVIKGLMYKSLYNLELEKNESYEREIQIRDSLRIKQEMTIQTLTEKLNKSLEDRGIPESMAYIIGILGSIATGTVVYLICGE